MFRSASSSFSSNHVISQCFMGTARSLSSTTSSRTSKYAVLMLSGKNRPRMLASMRSCYYSPSQQRQSPQQPSFQIWRTLSSNAGEKKANDGDNTNKGEETDHPSDETQIVLTPGQKVVAYSRLSMWAGIAVFAAFCAYYIGRELFPTKMSPNRVFDNALALVREDSQVRRRFGEPIKGYGRDHGGHREGRRNFIEHTERVDPEDGSKRTRVRFNIEGPHGNAFVFAEVSSEMPSGEFVYVLVQDKANGRVQTIVDNRGALTAQRLAGGNKESLAAMSQLLGGGKRN